ncbi:MAG: ABC transporter substrate-binding protein [Dehalococcoidia bacterium]
MASQRFWTGGRRQLGRRRLLGGVAAGGAAAAFLAACGGDSSDSSDSGAVSEGTVAPSTRTAATGQPKMGGTLNIRQSANAPLDPHLNSTFTAQTLASYVYARLLKYKTAPDPAFADNYETEGDLAETVEIPADGLTVTFKLRGNGTWQDVAPVSGRLVDSEDVKFSFERFRTDPKSTNRAVFGSQQNPLVESVETPDASTVVFRMAKPYGPFRNLIANSNYLWIMPKEIGAGTVDPARQMIGAGPFMLESTQPDIAYRVKKNPTYHGSPMPYVDGINLAIIQEEAQEVAQFQAGRLDVAGVPAERVDEVRQSVPRGELIEYIPQTFGLLAFQLRGDTPYKDERVRRAAQMSIDRDGLLSLIYQGKGTWQSAVPANFGQWRIDPATADLGAGAEYYKYNPAEAKKLLAAAGYPNGPTVKYVYTNNIYGERFNQTAEAIAGMLKEGGFNTQIVTQDYLREYITPGTGTFFGNFENVFYGLQTAFGDPHDYLYNMHHTRSARNHGGVSDPQLDAMLDKEEATLDDQQRITLVKEIQRYIADKVYYGMTAVGPAFIGVQEWIKNYQRNNGYGAGVESRAKLWIDRGS